MTIKMSRVACLLAACIASADAAGRADDFSARIDAAARAHAEARARYDAEYTSARTDDDRAGSSARFNAANDEIVRGLIDLARSEPGNPRGVEGLKLVIMWAGRGPSDASYRAMELLRRDHVADPGMGEVCGRAFHFAQSEVAEGMMRDVLARHPDRFDRGLACHALATLLDLRAGMVRSIRGGKATLDDYVHPPRLAEAGRIVAASDPEAIGRESDALLERTVAEFADVHDWFTPRRTIGAIAEGELFARHHLKVGEPAPDVAGVDHLGRAFSLSDHRGEVVVLAFSASWCGPCVQMYPQERALVERYKGRPFAMLGVNADEDVEKLRKSIDDGRITWRCWRDGGMDGPITTRWGVSAIPETFVIDRLGVIRGKDLRGEKLDALVEALMAEAAPANPAR